MENSFISNNSVEYKPGDIVFREGDSGNFMFAVIEGEVGVVKDEQIIYKIGPGEIIGEMAVIEDKPRSATIKALTECKLIKINSNKFNYLLQQTPAMIKKLMYLMSERLRLMNLKHELDE